MLEGPDCLVHTMVRKTPIATALQVVKWPEKTPRRWLNALDGPMKRKVIGGEISSVVSARWTISTIRVDSNLDVARKAISLAKTPAWALRHRAA